MNVGVMRNALGMLEPNHRIVMILQITCAAQIVVIVQQAILVNLGNVP